MIKPFIVIGDKTTHGGTVISADFTTNICGNTTAQASDSVLYEKEGLIKSLLDSSYVLCRFKGGTKLG
jgi:uncharacterized Zn-binding protein involved in type VI secretion